MRRRCSLAGVSPSLSVGVVGFPRQPLLQAKRRLLRALFFLRGLGDWWCRFRLVRGDEGPVPEPLDQLLLVVQLALHGLLSLLEEFVPVAEGLVLHPQVLHLFVLSRVRPLLRFAREFSQHPARLLSQPDSAWLFAVRLSLIQREPYHPHPVMEGCYGGCPQRHGPVHVDSLADDSTVHADQLLDVALEPWDPHGPAREHQLRRKPDAALLHHNLDEAGDSVEQILALVLEVLERQHKLQVVTGYHAVGLDHRLLRDRKRLHRAADLAPQLEERRLRRQHRFRKRFSLLAPEHHAILDLGRADEDICPRNELLEAEEVDRDLLELEDRHSAFGGAEVQAHELARAEGRGAAKLHRYRQSLVHDHDRKRSESVVNDPLRSLCNGRALVLRQALGN
mmetsp:Transcript_22563/g.53483  ORF Transcript_22563/g.53483 Transcript_22563/m.53483 type:complete len:394 (+) Transcript_22563:733-1914(+)